MKKTSGKIAFFNGGATEAVEIAESYGDPFPPPQIIDSGMGYFEMSFDSFSDTGPGTVVHGTELVTFNKSFEDSNGKRWQINETWLSDTYTEFKVAQAGPTAGAISGTPNYGTSNTLRSRTIIGQQGSGPSMLDIVWTTGIKSISRRNFGALDEVDIVHGSVGVVLEAPPRPTP